MGKNYNFTFLFVLFQILDIVSQLMVVDIQVHAPKIVSPRFVKCIFRNIGTLFLQSVFILYLMTPCSCSIPKGAFGPPVIFKMQFQKRGETIYSQCITSLH